MIRLVIIQRMFPVYRKFIFDKLNSKYQFKLIHSTIKSGIVQTKSKFSHVVPHINYGNGENSVILKLPFWFYSKRHDVVIHEFGIGILSIYWVFLLSKILRFKLIFWGHCYDRKKGLNPSKSIADKVRLFLLRKADAVIFYTRSNRNIFENLLDSDKLFVANNTLEAIEENLIHNQTPDFKDKHKYNFVFIGRLLNEKRPDILLQILVNLKSRGFDVGVHFIGDGEMLEELKEFCVQNDISNQAYFHGRLTDDYVIGKIMSFCDLMILPGYLGLSVNHAFLFNCPVVSFEQGENGPFHSPEVEYVVNWKTGYLAKNNDLEDMLMFINKYLSDGELRNAMKENIKLMVKNELSEDNMLDGFDKAINFVLSK